MNNIQFANLQRTLEYLTFVQLKRLRQNVDDMISANQVGKAIAVHEEGVCECAHCRSNEFTKYGPQNVVNSVTCAKRVLGRLIPFLALRWQA